MLRICYTNNSRIKIDKDENEDRKRKTITI